MTRNLLLPSLLFFDVVFPQGDRLSAPGYCTLWSAHSSLVHKTQIRQGSFHEIENDEQVRLTIFSRNVVVMGRLSSLDDNTKCHNKRHAEANLDVEGRA
jgi:hypothetical protein